ncbi:MAG: hypothetical protein LBV60_23875 [Streptomyces sp.]|nr:hypothetical protein [Streptomyces sp.]
MNVPDWWPQVAAAARSRRHFTGMLLDRAGCDWDGRTITLTLPGDGAAVWKRSDSGRVLDAALQQHGVNATVTVTAAS